MLAPVPGVDVRDAAGATISAHRHLTRHRVRHERELTRPEGRGDEDIRRGEVGIRLTAAIALAAVVARGASGQRPGEDREPRRDTGDIEPASRLLYQQLVAARLGGRQEDAVGGVWDVLFAPEHAHQL